MLSLEEAQEKMFAAARRVKGVDRVPLAEAAGRVLAEALVSAIDVPPADNSGMDGYALRCADVAAPGARLKVSQRIPAGSVGSALEPRTAARIFTGAPIPPGADAVVMQEVCTMADDHVVVDHVPTVGDHIRRAGEDIRRDAEVLPAGLRLTPQAIGMAASVGAAVLPVFRRLSVGLLSTGSELTEPGAALPPGGIYNSNRAMLRALLERLGCAVEEFGNVRDTLDDTRKALRKAGALHDLVLSSGGVSVGEEDHVRSAVAAEGEVSLWSLATKPGKPLAFGKIGNADFIGMPGNPVSVFVTFLLLARPFILKCQGAVAAPPRTLSLVSASAWTKPGPRREFLRARLRADGRVEFYPNQSSGVLTSTLWGDGFVDNPAQQAIAVGDVVRFLPFADLI
ncbi:MAG: molybdopterin molybdotransferase MoeA [Rhodocyclales bacterium]|nr:molybdopterin molybdotransferase MoeA [Rhodocyclales bacterium]